MKRSDKAARILEMLDELYPRPPIPLDHEDAFTLLVAVMLSAQTTDDRVNLVTPGLFRRAKTPHAMAKLSVETILSEIRSCGLAPGKARNLKGLAEKLVDEFGGSVPRDMAALESLPGVGHKTAGVVMAQAFGEAAFPVDTHIHRLAARWGLSDGKSVEKTERDLKAVFPRESWTRVHLSMIYFGREYCPARGHDLETCPICSWAATKKRKAEEARVGGGGPKSRQAIGRAKLQKRSSGPDKGPEERRGAAPVDETGKQTNKKTHEKARKKASRAGS